MPTCALCNQQIRPRQPFNRYIIEHPWGSSWYGDLCHVDCYTLHVLEQGDEVETVELVGEEDA